MGMTVLVERPRRRAFRTISVVPGLVGLVVCGALGACAEEDEAPQALSSGVDRGVLALALRSSAPGTVDPARCSDIYEQRLGAQVHEPLLQIRPGHEPLELEPLLLASLPESSEDGRVLTLRLKEGVRFHDDPCFPGGKGRELVAEDVVCSWKRLADRREAPSPSWSLLEGCIVGLDDYAMGLEEGRVTADAEVEGLRTLDERTVRVQLTEPPTRFLWLMSRYPLAIVPHEAVEEYGTRFGRHPVGTGPYTLAEKDWTDGEARYHAFADYHGTVEGEKLPRTDGLRYTFFDENGPVWQRYSRERSLDLVGVPADALEEVVNLRSGVLTEEYEDAGHQLSIESPHQVSYFGFHLDDPVVGGLDERGRKLRRALQLATDLEELNQDLYKGRGILFDGIVPPGLDGHPRGPDRRLEPRTSGPDLDRARELLAEAGHPEGRDLPPLRFGCSSHPASIQQVEMIGRQWRRIGVEVETVGVPFGGLAERIHQGEFQVFGYGWANEYPDAENDLSLFYGPFADAGCNLTHYRDPAFDEGLRQLRLLPPGQERSAEIERLHAHLLRNAPFVGSISSHRYWLAQPWLRHAHPSAHDHGWPKYVAIDLAMRSGDAR